VRQKETSYRTRTPPRVSNQHTKHGWSARRLALAVQEQDSVQQFGILHVPQP
jgi:hypothetical protein